MLYCILFSSPFFIEDQKIQEENEFKVITYHRASSDFNKRCIASETSYVDFPPVVQLYLTFFMQRRQC